nr:hypothetical protein [Tanacetum cinerariifolium]
VQQSSEYSPPEAGLIVPVFPKGDDPIDAIRRSTRQTKGHYVLQLQRRRSHVQAMHKTQEEARCRMVQG